MKIRVCKNQYEPTKLFYATEGFTKISLDEIGLLGK